MSVTNTRFGGRYQLVREIGVGGMGRVFQAVDTQTGQSVAAKILIAKDDDDPDGVMRFYQEAAVLSTLKHPNIVQVYGTYLEGQTSCIVMELLEGRSLGTILRHERLSLPRTKHLIEQVASALAFAHGRSIVHRDVKPDNIMVVGDDHVKVTDFGIARVLLAGLTLQTMTGHSIGTPMYMSPEQIEGQKVDGRSDIYSLGVVLYHCVTGRPPFVGDDPITIAFKHVHREPEPPRELNDSIPEDWNRLILTMLAKNPADRFQTAAEVGEALAGLSLDGSAAQMITPSPVPPRQVPVEPVLPRRPVEEPISPPTVSEAPVRDREAEPLSTRPISSAESAPPAPPVTAAAARETAPSGPPPGDAHGPDIAPRRRPIWPFAAGVAALVIVLAAAYELGHRNSSSAANRPPAPPRVTGVTLLATWKGSLLFDRPEDIAFDRSGRAYVADYTADRISIVDPSTVRALSSIGVPGNGRGQLSSPSGVAVDRAGNVYVADSNNSRIVEFSPSGHQVHAWGSNGSGPGQFAGPHDVAVDAAGDIYITDFGNNRVQELAPSGRVLASFGGSGTKLGQFRGPTSLALDAAGNVYVTDFYNNRIEKFSSTGRPLLEWRGASRGFARPHGVAVDARGDVYLTDFQHSRVVELSPAGKVLRRWGKPGSGRGEFRQPDSIAVDPAGHVYVVGTGNDRIQEFALPS